MTFQVVAKAGMTNEDGRIVDTYIPRKCSYTSRILSAKEHASVQINVGEVDENGVYTRQNKTYCMAGFMRGKGEADQAFNTLFFNDTVISFEQ